MSKEENIFTVERITILEILGVKNDTLKTIIRKKQLETRLKEKGYLLFILKHLLYFNSILF